MGPGLPARRAQGVSAFKAAFVPRASSRKNYLAAPQQEKTRPLGSTGSATQLGVGPRPERPEDATTLPPAEGWPGSRTAHQGGMGEDCGLWGGRAWSPALPFSDLRSPGQFSGCPERASALVCGKLALGVTPLSHVERRVRLRCPRLLSAAEHLECRGPAPAQARENIGQLVPGTPLHTQGSPDIIVQPVCISPKDGELTPPGPAWEDNLSELECTGNSPPWA